MESHHYLICGITISFPWEMAMFPVSSKVPDVYVKLGQALPPAEKNVKFKGPYCLAAPHHVFFHLENIARFSVLNGTEITVEILGEQDIETLNIFLLNSCLGVLLTQRNKLVLHAAALERNGRIVAFSGGAGCGKSTLSGLLLKSGARILTDNIATIEIQERTGARVFPSFPFIHLWHSAIEKVELEARKTQKLRPNLNKYALSIEDQFCAEPSPLHTLCILSPWNKSELHCEEINGIERITYLSHASFRLKITRGMEMDRQHFQHMSALSQTIKLVKLSYPHDWNLNEQLVTFVNGNLFESLTESSAL
ncbi:hypothetical protein [Terasakiella pusilla]|uniref:hypothetical protein n=1 Tax=Terasakiella pusilla TaxID=64973 RepID=UPI003AA8097C